jgi:hypothetical protein
MVLRFSYLSRCLHRQSLLLGCPVACLLVWSIPRLQGCPLPERLHQHRLSRQLRSISRADQRCQSVRVLCSFGSWYLESCCQLAILRPRFLSPLLRLVKLLALSTLSRSPHNYERITMKKMSGKPAVIGKSLPPMKSKPPKMMKKG